MKNLRDKKIPTHSRFRDQIRSKNIQQIFGLKRAQMIPSKLNDVFKDIQQEIKKSINEPISLCLVNKLLNIFQVHPHHENTFILIGNYLIDHQSAQRYLIPRILGADSETKKLHNWKWVIVLGIVSKNQNDQWSKNILFDYDKIVSQIITESLAQDDIRKSLDIASLLLNILEQSSEKPFMPMLCVKSIQNKISMLNGRNLRYDLKYLIVEVCCQILQNYFAILSEDQPTQCLSLQIYMNVMYLALNQFPNFRPSYFWFLQKLSLNYPTFIQYFINKTDTGKILLKEIFYLFSQSPIHQKIILEVFRYWSHMFCIQDLVNLLNMGLHTDLLSIVMYNQFQVHQKGRLFISTNQQLDFSEESIRLIALKNVKIILDRLREKQEQKLLERVLTDFDQNQFEKWAQEFYEKRQEKQLEDTLSQILDDYYSDEVLE